MPGRKYQRGNLSYRYSINGQEKESELNENITTAEFWEYDSRIGRRWNLDPKPTVGLSKYSTFGGNPIWFSDPKGDTTFVFNEYGKYLKTINDNLPNESHFVRSIPYLTVVKKGETLANAHAKQIRAESVAFIGANTASDAKKLEAKANKDGHELFFLGKIDATKEVRLTEITFPKEAYVGSNEISVGDYIDRGATNEQQQSAFLIGHTHQLNLEKNNFIDSKLPTLPGKNAYFNSDNGSGDYAPLLNRPVIKHDGTNGTPTYTINEKSQTAALIVTHTGITIYGTGTKYNAPGPYGRYSSVDNIVPPAKQSFITYKSLKR